MPSTVSVVIPFYNCAYVGQALTSCLNQTHPPLEIIVVDDGSTVHVDKLLPFAHRVRYVRKTNGGTGSALNQGVRLAEGEYIAWLSSDDMFEPGKLERQLAFMKGCGSEISHTAYSVMDENSVITEPFRGMPINGMLDFYRLLTCANPVNGCTMIARKDTLLRAGLFNDALPYTQDYEMWLRMAWMGVNFDYLPEPLTRYRVHKQMGTVKNQAAVKREFEAVMASYRERIESKIRQLGGR